MKSRLRLARGFTIAAMKTNCREWVGVSGGWIPALSADERARERELWEKIYEGVVATDYARVVELSDTALSRHERESVLTRSIGLCRMLLQNRILYIEVQQRHIERLVQLRRGDLTRDAIQRLYEMIRNYNLRASISSWERARLG